MELAPYTKTAYLVLILAFASSCKVYNPQLAPLPLLTERNELQIDGGISAPAGCNVAIAYSPVSNIGIQVFGSLSAESGYHYQGAIGYYWNKNPSLKYEIYTGIATGNGTAFKTSRPGSLNGDYSTYFLQMNLGQESQWKKPVEYGIGLKFGLFNAEITDNGFYESDGLDPVVYSNSYFLIEPIAFARFGNKKLRVGLQMNGVSLINTRQEQRQIPYNTVALGIHLNYRLKMGVK